MANHYIFLSIVCFMILTLAPICVAQNSPQDFLDAHNEARKEVGVAPLEWNETLVEYATDYANKLLPSCDLVHSNGPYGENIAAGYGTFSGVEAVKYWLTEKPNYDHDSNKCIGDECLHYTQIIWGNSLRLGCGRVKCAADMWIIICSYDPWGNVLGEKPY